MIIIFNLSMEFSCASFPSSTKNLFGIVASNGIAINIKSNSKVEVRYNIDGSIQTTQLKGALSANTFYYFEMKQTLVVDKVGIMSIITISYFI